MQHTASAAASDTSSDQEASVPRHLFQPMRDICSVQLLVALTPILPLLHAFLDDADAARLLRTSHTAALALLRGYVFTKHVFQPADLASLRRLRDHSRTYGLRLIQLDLPGNVRELTFDPSPPHLSPIPASVVDLNLSPGFPKRWDDEPSWDAVARWSMLMAALRDRPVSESWHTRSAAPPSAQSGGEEEKEKEEQRVWMRDPLEEEIGVFLPWLGPPYGSLNGPLLPGILPTGLRVLRMNGAFQQQLQPGWLPATLLALQLSNEHNVLHQPLLPGALPASLLHLCGGQYTRRLLPGSLPASLERLRLVRWNLHLQVGVLPQGLKALMLGCFNKPLQPRVLPSSLTFMFLEDFDQPLAADTLPASLRDLEFYAFNHPLTPGVLPASLRRLTLGSPFSQQLQLGSLPDGLLYLRFTSQQSGVQPHLLSLHPGVLPSTLLGLDLSNRCVQPLSAGVIPPSVRWVRLSSRYRNEGIEAKLSPQAKVTWWEHGAG